MVNSLVDGGKLKGYQCAFFAFSFGSCWISECEVGVLIPDWMFHSILYFFFSIKGGEISVRAFLGSGLDTNHMRFSF